MKSLFKSTFILAAALLVLAGCAPAADPKDESGDNGADDTPANKVLSIAFSGTYDKVFAPLSATTDISAGTAISLKINAPATDGVVLLLLDATGKVAYYWVPGTGDWATVTLSTNATGFFNSETDKGWADTGFDGTQVVSFGVAGFEHVETAKFDDVVFGTALAADFDDGASPFVPGWDVATIE